MAFIYKNGQKLATPYVLYHGDFQNKNEFNSVFGRNKNHVNSSFGPYYYFSTYSRAIRYAGWSIKEKKKYQEEEK